MRRDLLLRHDRTVHAKDGGAPLMSEGKRRSGPKTAQQDDFNFNDQDENENGLDPMDEANDELGDLEAAGMLLTDFHNKAMATHESDIAGENDLSTGSPTGPSFLEPSVTYGNGSVALPQMPWDSLMPHPTLQEQPVYAVMESHSNQLPPIMDHQSPTGDGHHHFGGHMTMSGLATPGALSPFPSMMGPVSPVDYRRSPGPSQALTVTKAPQVNADEQCARILENIKRCDSEAALLETFRLPNRTVLNHYLSTYFNLFHHHLPFLHPASFNPTEVAAPLLLAVLSIGALYTFEQDQAFMLHIGSKVLVNQFLQKEEDFNSRKCPLWTMQATLLNMIFASWSGDPKGLEWACSIKSLLANVCLIHAVVENSRC